MSTSPNSLTGEFSCHSGTPEDLTCIEACTIIAFILALLCFSIQCIRDITRKRPTVGAEDEIALTILIGKVNDAAYV